MHKPSAVQKAQGDGQFAREARSTALCEHTVAVDGIEEVPSGRAFHDDVRLRASVQGLNERYDVRTAPRILYLLHDCDLARAEEAGQAVLALFRNQACAYTVSVRGLSPPHRVSSRKLWRP